MGYKKKRSRDESQNNASLNVTMASVAILFLIVSPLSVPAERFYRGSSSAIITDLCPSTEEEHLALNISISPVVPYISCVYNFVTHMYEVTNFTGNNFSLTSADGVERQYEQILHRHCFANNSVISYRDLRKVPDLSVWSDRSVLILAVHRLSFTSEPTCPEIYVCAISSEKCSSSSQCSTGLGEVSGSCIDEVNETHFFLFPLASALKISVSNVGKYTNPSSNNVHMVVTTGYRLPPGVFTCPSGFFACQSFNKVIEPRDSPLNWTYRICLPLELWCDGVENCPITGSDERKCSISSPPMKYSHTNAQILDEYKMLGSILEQYSKNTSLLKLVGYKKISEKQVVSFALVNILSFSLGLLAMISVIAVLIFKCISLKKRRRSSTIKVIDEKSYHEVSNNTNSSIINNKINGTHLKIDCFTDQSSNQNNINENNNNHEINRGVNDTYSDYYQFLPSSTYEKIIVWMM
ncbi:unnamed protein product [Heterobilharzia americana]|nr:unnamed protein product [Heterobilharzia americana]